jgi:hypothetical protein
MKNELNQETKDALTLLSATFIAGLIYALFIFLA